MAEHGDPKAKSIVGYMYDKGYGITKDCALALKWYRKAASQGNDSAICNLGVMYEYGEGVTQDYAEAVNMYRQSADKGNLVAQCNLGNMYEKGLGVDKNYDKAKALYRKAAEQGNARAKTRLRNLSNVYDCNIPFNDPSNSTVISITQIEVGDVTVDNDHCYEFQLNEAHKSNKEMVFLEIKFSNLNCSDGNIFYSDFLLKTVDGTVYPASQPSDYIQGNIPIGSTTSGGVGFIVDKGKVPYQVLYRTKYINTWTHEPIYARSSLINDVSIFDVFNPTSR